MAISNTLLSGQSVIVALKKLNAENALASLHQKRSIVALKDLPSLCDPLIPLSHHFTKIRRLDLGSFGIVNLYKGPKDVHFAIKEQLLPFSMLHKINHIHHPGHEFKIGMALDHPNIVKVHHLILKVQSRPKQVRCYLIMEFVRNSRTKSDSSQLVSAVKHCLEQKIVPGDLKPKNTLVTKEGVLKLVDFGNYTWIKPEVYPYLLFPRLKTLATITTSSKDQQRSRHFFIQAEKQLKLNCASLKNTIDFLYEKLK